eukprot:UN02219
MLNFARANYHIYDVENRIPVAITLVNSTSNETVDHLMEFIERNCINLKLLIHDNLVTNPDHVIEIVKRVRHINLIWDREIA